MITIERYRMPATGAPLGVVFRSCPTRSAEQHIRLESMAEPSLTQTSEQSPKIFIDTAGVPLPVYLDVNPEIPARPRLIRLLRVRAIMLCMYSIG
jgi:hypothetical protein